MVCWPVFPYVGNIYVPELNQFLIALVSLDLDFLGDGTDMSCFSVAVLWLVLSLSDFYFTSVLRFSTIKSSNSERRKR